MLWNGFPNYVSKALLHGLKSNVRNCDVINEINNNKENETEIFFCLPYAGSKGEQLVKHCLKKIRRCLKINVKFVVIYDTKKISFYCNVKDKVPHEQRNNIVYRIRCPGCGGKYIGKTLNLCLNICQNVKCLQRHVICMLFHHYIMKVTRMKFH